MISGPPFTSNTMFDGQPTSASNSLQSGQMAEIVIDATGFIAHVMFKGSDNLGILYDGYQLNQNLTISEGTT